MNFIPLRKLLITNIKNGYSPNCTDEPTGKWVLGLGSLDGNGLNLKAIKPVPINNHDIDRYILRNGDFLVSRSNTWDKVGRSALFRGEIQNCAYPDLMMRFRIDEKKVLPDFLDEYLRSDIARKHFMRCAAGTSGSMVKITKSVVENLTIRLPSLSEQKAIVDIAKIASTIVKNIESLIYNKEHLFKWLSNSLIWSSKTDWNSCTLKEISRIRKGQQLNRDILEDSGEYPVWNGGITPSGYTDKSNTMANTITISEGGNSSGFVNSCKEDFWLGGHCYAVEKLDCSIDPDFLFFCLKVNEQRIMRLRVGSGLPNIQKKDIEKLQIQLPPIEEQKRIAATLNITHQEINLLKKLADQYRTQKRGLMQKLLTGKWRMELCVRR